MIHFGPILLILDLVKIQNFEYHQLLEKSLPFQRESPLNKMLAFPRGELNLLILDFDRALGRTTILPFQKPPNTLHPSPHYQNLELLEL